MFDLVIFLDSGQDTSIDNTPDMPAPPPVVKKPGNLHLLLHSILYCRGHMV